MLPLRSLIPLIALVIAAPAVAQDAAADAFAAAAPGLMEADGNRPEQTVEIALDGCRITQRLRTTLEAEDGPADAEQQLSVDLRDVAPEGVIALGGPTDPYVTINFLLTPLVRGQMQEAAAARQAALQVDGDVSIAAATFNEEALAGGLGDRLARSHAIQVMGDGDPQVFPLTSPPRLIFSFDGAQAALDAMYDLHTGECAPDPADMDAG